MRARISAIPVRVNPLEIVLLTGLLADALRVERDSVEECEEIWSMLNALRTHGLDPEAVELSEPQRRFLDQLKKAGLLEVFASLAACNVTVVGEGVLATLLRRSISKAGLGLGERPLCAFTRMISGTLGRLERSTRGRRGRVSSTYRST